MLKQVWIPQNISYCSMGYLDSLYFTHYLIIKLFFPKSRHIDSTTAVIVNKYLLSWRRNRQNPWWRWWVARLKRLFQASLALFVLIK